MFLLQIAVTSAIVHIVSDQMLRAALNPLRVLASGRPPEFPVWTIRVAFWSFWTAVVAGIAGVWSI